MSATDLTRMSAVELVDAMATGADTLVELGSGTSEKTRLLLHAPHLIGGAALQHEGVRTGDPLRPVRSVHGRGEQQQFAVHHGRCADRRGASGLQPGKHRAFGERGQLGGQVTQARQDAIQHRIGRPAHLERERALPRRGRPGAELEEFGDRVQPAEASQSGGGEHHGVQVVGVDAAEPRVDVPAEVDDLKVRGIPAFVDRVLSLTHDDDAAGHLSLAVELGGAGPVAGRSWVNREHSESLRDCHGAPMVKQQAQAADANNVTLAPHS